MNALLHEIDHKRQRMRKEEKEMNALLREIDHKRQRTRTEDTEMYELLTEIARTISSPSPRVKSKKIPKTI